MAIGLIKKEIIHGSGKSRSPFLKSQRQKDLTDATLEYEKQMGLYQNQAFTNPYAKNVFEGMENTKHNKTNKAKQMY